MPTFTCPLCGHRLKAATPPPTCPSCKAQLGPEPAQAEPPPSEPDVDALSLPAEEWEDGAAEFSCPSCHESYSVSAGLAGKAIRCRQCGELCRVPSPRPATPSPPPKPKEKTPPPRPKAAKPAAPSEPWYFGFLERCANASIALGFFVCLFGCILIPGIYAQALKDSNVPGPVVILAILCWFLVFLGITVGAAFTLLAVDAARSLRSVRPKETTDTWRE